MRFTYDEDSDDDRTLLMKFFKSLREGFREIVYDHRWGDQTIAFYGDGQRYLRGALEETEREFDRVLSAVNEVSQDKLSEMGLWGQSLRAKLYYIRYWADRAIRGLRGAILKTLENINIVLGSFFSASGFGEAIKELKDLIKNNLKTI